MDATATATATVSITADELAKLRIAQVKLEHRREMKKAQNQRYWKKKQSIKKAQAAAAKSAAA